VTLESDNEGNAYLHLILPADKINFLNGNSNYTFYNSTENDSGAFGNGEDYDQMLIEVGCKVYEVNRILYKSNPTDPITIVWVGESNMIREVEMRTAASRGDSSLPSTSLWAVRLTSNLLTNLILTRKSKLPLSQ